MEMGLKQGLTQVFVHHWFPASPVTHQAKRSLRWCEGEKPLGVVYLGNSQTLLIPTAGTLNGSLAVKVVFQRGTGAGGPEASLHALKLGVPVEESEPDTQKWDTSHSPGN